MSATEHTHNEIDIRQIFKLLPHRYPFLLVDRIISIDSSRTIDSNRSIDSSRSITAIKNVTFNEPFFPGHFENNPIMPGVLIIEAMVQACCILASHYSDVDEFVEQGAACTLTRIDKARFLRPVIPGDTLILKANIMKFRAYAQSNIYAKFNTTASVNENLVSSAELSAMLTFTYDDAKDS